MEFRMAHNRNHIHSALTLLLAGFPGLTGSAGAATAQNPTSTRAPALEVTGSSGNQTFGDGEQYEQTKEHGDLKIRTISVNPLRCTHNLAPIRY